MADVWDLEDKSNIDKTPACLRLQQQPQPYFEKVFKNDAYEILKVVESPEHKHINSQKDPHDDFDKK